MSIFIENKYTKWYYNIISNATKLNRFKYKRSDPQYVYYELHHIIPRSLNGSDDSYNLVLLTAKEHFICHLLLTKMCLGVSKQRMIHAANLFVNYKNIKINSKIYAYIKKNLSHSIETKQKISNSNKGKTKSKEHREKLAKAQSLNKGERSPNFGKKYSQERRNNISTSTKGRIPWNKGKTGVYSEETKKKMSEGVKKFNLSKKSCYSQT